MASSSKKRGPSQPRQRTPQAVHVRQQPPETAIPGIVVPAVGRTPINSPESTPGVHEGIQGAIDPPMRALEEILGFPVIAYFLDDSAAIADEQMSHLFEHVRRVGHVPTLGLWISSRGGATEVPVKIVSLMREYADRFVVLVPYRAHSAATQVALGADEIVMSPMAELGPVDPSRRHPLLPKEPGGENGQDVPISVAVQDLRHVVQFVDREVGGAGKLTPEAAATIYTSIFNKVHPLAIGALEQTWALSQQVCERVLSTHMDPATEAVAIKAIVERLSDYYKSHLYQIDRREAKEIGLKVRDATDAESDAMWALLVTFSNIQLGGDGEIGGEKALVNRLGHLASRAGSTIGLGMRKVDSPEAVAATRWESKWRVAPGGAPLVEAEAPQASGPPEPLPVD